MLSHRFDDALAFASQIHRAQRRKGSDVPYISHLLSVCALTLEYGGDEDCAIAALLHDAVEDHGGLAMADQIEEKFGTTVRDIVLECSDRGDDQDTPWRFRKDAYLASIPRKSEAAILVTSCDKLHNATMILNDLRNDGLSVFSRFSAGRDEVLWYYRQLLDRLSMRAPYALTLRLSIIIAQIEADVSLKLNSDD